jgi:hypothetical protein
MRLVLTCLALSLTTPLFAHTSAVDIKPSQEWLPPFVGPLTLLIHPTNFVVPATSDDVVTMAHSISGVALSGAKDMFK